MQLVLYHALLLMCNPLNAKLNPICHLLALLGAHHILHVSRIRVNDFKKNVPDLNCKASRMHAEFVCQVSIEVKSTRIQIMVR